MRRSGGALLAGIVLFTGLQAGAAAPTVQQIVSQFDPVNYSNILSHALYTRQGMNRLATTGAHHDLCRDAIYAEFVKAGVTPSYDWFQFQDSNNVTRTTCNIVAVKQGVQNPLGEIYVAGGHYDSKNNPGADDNGTGVAAILEMARIFSQYEFAKTIVFVAFDCEEIWDFYGAHRLGSLHFADLYKTENIAGMVSVDMIGFEASATANTAWLYGWASSAPVTNKLATALTNYGGLSVFKTTSNPNISDHVAFANMGFPACLLIESTYSSNPNYHKIGDFVEQPGYIDWDYVGRMAKGAMGYFAEQIQPVDIVPRALSLSSAPGGGLELAFSGLPGCRYAIESCTNLAAPQWIPVITNTAATDGTFKFVELNPGGKPRCFYRARFVSGVAQLPRPWQQIIDNTAASFVGSYTLGVSTIIDRYHWNYAYFSLGSGSYAEFRPTIPVAGNYQVYEWHSVGGNRTTDAPIEVKYAAGQQTVRVNQQVLGGQWNLVGTYYLNAGTDNYVRIRNDFTTGSVVIVDAIRFVQAP